ncbi:hypothetical protein DBA20_19100 [Pandoraea capi]|nr:hypothetical protein [Pandoraea sp. LA3]MDN4585085.1 hypothetical protein [Pandoraea capi]
MTPSAPVTRGEVEVADAVGAAGAIGTDRTGRTNGAGGTSGAFGTSAAGVQPILADGDYVSLTKGLPVADIADSSDGKLLFVTIARHTELTFTLT